MAEAVKKLKYFSQDEVDRYWPEMIEKYEMDMNSNREYWKNEYLAIGEKIGEKRKEKCIAKNMLKLGIDIETILISTELSKEEILEIQKNI